MAQKQKVEVMYLELVDQKASGFVLDGTRDTLHQHELQAPSMQWIFPTAKAAEFKEDAQGRKLRHDIEIRFINGCDSIIPKEQQERGFVPNRFEDKIGFENGFATIFREGSTIGLYDFLKRAYYNADNPDRPGTATPRYREVKLDQHAAEFIDNDEMEARAKTLVYSLRKKGANNAEVYNEEKINTWCRLLQVTEETPQRKLVVLLNQAKANPAKFIQLVEQAEQIIFTEITHALQLDVISFEGNIAQYKNGNVIIKALGSGKMNQDQKIETLADWFGTEEGNSALTDMRTHLEIAKENKFKNS